MPDRGLAGINYWPSNNKGGKGGGGGTPPSGGNSVNDNPDDRYYPGYTNGLDNYGPRLRNTDVAAVSLYGVTKPYHFGTGRMIGNIIWAKALSERKLVTQNQAGGQDTSYQYYGTFRISFGTAGDLDIEKRALLRVWADGKLIIDNRVSGRTIAKGVYYRFYPGLATQEKDPTMVAFDGDANTPAYRDDIGIVFVDLPLGAYDNKIPVIAAEIGDSDNEANIISTISASGQSSNVNSQPALVDPSTMRMYAVNQSGVHGWHKYDWINSQFLGHVIPNQTGVPQGSNPTATSIETLRPIRYSAWDKVVIASPNTTENSQTLMALDAELGFVRAYVPNIVQRPFTMSLGRVNLGFAGETATIIATTSDGNRMEYVKFLPHINAMESVYSITGSDYDENTVHVFRIGDSSGIDHFASNGDSVDLIRLSASTIFPPPLQPNPAPVITTDHIAYDGMGSTAVRSLFYYPERDALLIIYDSAEARLVNLQTMSNIWRTTLAATPASGSVLYGDSSGGKIGWVNSGGNLRELSLDNGSLETFTVASGTLNPGETFYHSPSRSLFGIGVTTGLATRVFLERANGNQVTLKKIIETAATLSGFAPGVVQVDASVTDIVDGAIIKEPTSFMELMESIKTIYGYTVYESGANVKVVNKMDTFVSPDITIVGEDFVVESPSDAGFKVARTEENAIPSTMRVTYMDRTLNYYWNTATATRGVGDTNSSQNQMEVKLPFIMEAEDAKKLAYKALWRAWVGRVSYSFTLGTEYPDVEPGDTIAITVDANEYLVQAIDVDFNPNFTEEISAIDFLPNEDYDVQAFAGTAFQQEISEDVFAEFLYIDTPLLFPEDEAYSQLLGTRYYYIIAPTAPSATFNGAYGFFSYNNGTNWAPLEFSDFAVPVGRLSQGVGVPEHYNATDFDNTINFQLTGGDSSFLQSLSTEAEMYEGANMALIGAPGRWEVIHFQNVTQELDGSFTISNILRAARGTHYLFPTMFKHTYASTGFGGLPYSASARLEQVSPHKPGDYFVLIDDSWLKKAYHPMTPVELRAKFATASKVNGAADNATKEYVVNRNDIMPLPGGCVRVQRDSFGRLTISWADEGRLNATFPDDGAAPFANAADELQVFDIYLEFSGNDYQDFNPITNPVNGLQSWKPLFHSALFPELWYGNIGFEYGGAIGGSQTGLSLCYRVTVTGANSITLPARIFDWNPDGTGNTSANPVPAGILSDVTDDWSFGLEAAKGTLDYNSINVAVCKRSTWTGFNQALDVGASVFMPMFQPSAAEEPSINTTAADQTSLNNGGPNRSAAGGGSANQGHVWFTKVYVEDV